MKKPLEFKDEYVWHYTRLEALLSIIKNKELWLSNLKYTNDPLECEFSYTDFDKLLKILSKKNKQNKLIYDTFLKMDPKGFKIDSNIYSVSFSKKNDNMQHWQVYGDNFRGVALRINVGKIKKLISDTGFANQYLYYLEMKYQTQDLSLSIEEYINSLLEQYKDYNLDIILPSIITSAYNMSLLQNKSEIFLGEDETRFALYENFMTEALNNYILEPHKDLDLDAYGFSKKMKKFYFSKGLIKSRYQIILKSIWDDDLIDSVVIGPLCNQDHNELKDFLMANGLNNVDVIESKLKGKVRF